MSERIFNFPIPMEHVMVDAAIICCIDPRFWNASPDNGLGTISALAHDRGWKFVPLTVAGGIKVLVSDDPADAAQKESLLFRIGQELDLHQPPILVASVHWDCGAYGYSKAFGNDAASERERLSADLQKAGRLLADKFGSRLRELKLLMFDAVGVEEFELADSATA